MLLHDTQVKSLFLPSHLAVPAGAKNDAAQGTRSMFPISIGTNQVTTLHKAGRNVQMITTL